MRPYIVASIVVFMGAFIRIANAQCGCCSQPNCWCCPQTTTNATTAASLKVCSSTCADTISSCAQYSSLCNSTLYRNTMLINCRCTCGLCSTASSVGACAGINPGSAIGPCINGTCASPALCVNGQCEC